MKKIMFSDAYNLTEAVLSGRKTQTRRIVTKDTPLGSWKQTEAKAHYKVGEIVAVAQSYKNIVERIAKKGYDAAKWMDEHRITKNLAGWLNKMFVKASLMIFKVRITNVRVERLQEISDEDCIAEGVEIVESFYQPANGNKQQVNYYRVPIYCKSGRVLMLTGDTPREAYAILIDRIAGKGTWQSNPYVFVYDFELLK